MSHFVFFRLDVKSVRGDSVDVIYEKDTLQEISKVKVWDYNQDIEWVEKEWDPIEDNEYWKGFKAVKVKQLKEGHTYDIRLIGVNEEKCDIVSTRERVTTGESKYI